MTPRTLLMLVSFTASVAIGLVLSRRGDEATPVGGRAKRKVLVGLSLDTLKEARWQAERDMFVARVEALGGEVLVQAANSDDTRQMADVEALLSRGVDVLVIVPHDGTAMGKAVALAKKAGVPVIAYDRLIRDSAVDLYLSFQNVKVGELQAKFLVERMPKGRIVRIYGARTDQNASMLKEGQDAVLKPYIDRGDIQVVHEDWAEEWKPESAKKITNAALTAHGNGIDAILASNDGTAGGAIQALIEEGLAGKVIVTGQDAELVACQRIIAGTQAMTIYKPLHVLASRAAEAAVKLAKREPIVANASVNNGALDVPAVLSEVVTVTKENIDATIVKDGFHTREALYGAP